MRREYLTWFEYATALSMNYMNFHFHASSVPDQSIVCCKFVTVDLVAIVTNNE